MKSKSTYQEQVWKNEFGQSFTDRWNVSSAQIDNRSKRNIGITVTDLFKKILGKRRIKTILEVGCNAGNKLEILSHLGNFDLYGIDPQRYALQIARRRLTSLNLIEGVAYDLPFKDNFFDLVFTYEVLIHIPPPRLTKAMTEIVRVSKKYIFGMEYYSDKPEQVVYRGKPNILWKRDFEGEYLKRFPGLKSVAQLTFEWNEKTYGQRKLFSRCFLLSK